jgi:ABC-2 type transport system permease protein
VLQDAWIIFKKEMRSYFNSAIAYIFITIYLVFTSWLFFRNFFIINQADFRIYFDILPWVFLFFVPAITMRIWAEERKLGTFEILMTLPVKTWGVILGKFSASFTLLVIIVLLSIPLPITVSIVGDPDWGPIIGGYLGTLLMGAAYLSIGCFISSITENQIVAFIVAVTVTFIMLIIGEGIVLFSLPHVLVPLFEYLGLGSHFESIGRGVIDSRDIIYYLSVISFFLYLTYVSIENKK